MKILVDADACPVKEIIVRQAKSLGIPVTMLIDTSHVLDDGYSTVIIVDKGRDSADIRLVNLIEPGDLVVTQDFGVAAMSLSRGATALNQNGMVYGEDNMDRLLFERALGQKIRRAGGKAGKNRKRTKEDDESFARQLEKMIRRTGKSEEQFNHGSNL
ncbi:YaiI/YqxD family protein [Caproicibacter sp.]|uniref:YaiI/YqxD family protein n=1 Tax=Caproicibacter sp. TaxID=2814884 RepID=UPI003989BD06